MDGDVEFVGFIEFLNDSAMKRINLDFSWNLILDLNQNLMSRRTFSHSIAIR